MPAPLRGVFATPQMAQDIDAIRRMFGYERVSLFAVSYGTRVATAYAAAHPRHLDRLVLDSVAPEHAYYPGIAGNFDAALERAFAGCEASPACRARFPQFRRHYREVMTTLQARPIRLHLPGGRYPDDTVSLNAEDFSLLMQQLLYGDELIPTLPLLIDALRGGDSAPLALLFDVAVGMRVSGLNFGTYYLVLGNDELPRVRAEGRTAPAPGALAFFAQDLQLLDALGLFDGAATAATAATARPPAGPVLVLAGALDPITAPEYARALAQGLPQARHLEIPASGHTPSLADDCARASMVAFLSGDDRPLACTEALPSVAWAGDVYRGAWPRNWLEAIVLPRSTLPLLWFGLVALMYALLVLGLPVAAVYRRLRGRRSPAAPLHPLDRRARTLGLSALAAGIVVLVGLCALLASAVTGAAPASLLFGLPVAGYALAAVAASLVLLTALSVFALVRAWRHGGGRRRFHLWLACVAAVNLGLVGFLLRWQVFLPG
jgi:pimeloyl-ACP methyl ester carboxylesterase